LIGRDENLIKSDRSKTRIFGYPRLKSPAGLFLDQRLIGRDENLIKSDRSKTTGLWLKQKTRAMGVI
jgi:hypothetical protein